MAADRTETNNLTEQFPEKVRELHQLYLEWAGKTDVENWADLKVNLIPFEDNPLTRFDEELQDYFRVMTEMKVPPFN